ncbi:N,N-dimethylformamidase beta subunit family domain-containing protein [Mesorhizobium sp.]|uniref:N,N-dimethylformamidase beta subunit family domain-containing protein n=1 Tax=Mesorhizobium sp. TaxID=1871066 RepID=UPI003567A443
MSRLPLRGYSDRPNVALGDNIDFFIHDEFGRDATVQLVELIHGDPNPEGPGFHSREIVADINGTYPCKPQFTQLGGFVEVPDPGGRLAGGGGFTLHLYLAPSLPHRNSTVISRWATDTGIGWKLEISESRLKFTVSDGVRTGSISADRPLAREVWYAVCVTFDPYARTLRLSQRAIVNAYNSRLSRTTPLDANCMLTETCSITPGDSGVPVIIAGCAEAAGERTRVTALFNGKIDSPLITKAALDGQALSKLETAGIAPDDFSAHWDFAAGITRNGIDADAVADTSGNGMHGICYNQPDRAMTGWNWDGSEERFVHAPDMYGAIWFHEDSLDDCRWDKTLSFNVPADLPSAIYALRIRAGSDEDHIPFFVTPAQGAQRKRIAFLVPTFSYIAYANSQVMQNADSMQLTQGAFATLEDIDLEMHEARPLYGFSVYDLHADGRGVQYSSWRRPILNLRPHYKHEFGAFWQFPADLYIIDWLKHFEREFDIITDHDLDTLGADLLKHYNVVITGSHPEYYSGNMLDAWEDYISTGGRAMYMAANGFYWVATLDPKKPWMLEVRKGETGDQAWRARPGELYHSTTGEKGGLWRMRGRPPQKLWAVGYTAHGADISVGYSQMPDAASKQARWIMDGVGPDEIIGNFGLINGGASGLEMDRMDYDLGTPPHTLLLASSIGHTANAMLTPEDQFAPYPGQDGIESPLVRGDLALYTSGNGGAVFSVSSMAWAGSLSHENYQNNVSRITLNVLDRFQDRGQAIEIA